MSEDAPTATALQRASDGKLRGGPNLRDPREWRALMADHGAPGSMLAAVLIAAFVTEMFRGGPEVWGLSGRALADGRWSVLLSHMFAHGGVVHLAMNLSALLPLSFVVMVGLAGGVSSWLRFLTLFLLSGLAGGAGFLALHPFGEVPMVGASGAICGLWGAAARVDFDGGLVPLRSGQVWEQIKAFAKTNAILFTVIFVLVRLVGGKGGLAWEAHLGGFLFGLFAMPWFARFTGPQSVNGNTT